MKRLAAALLLLIAGCADGETEAPFSVELASLLGDSTRHTFHVGAVDTPAAVFSRITDARISPDGAAVVVLDRAEPFVRVFDRQGRIRSSFMMNGAGPGESRGPYGVAVSRAGLVLVLHLRLSVFDLNGAYVAGAAPGELLPSSAVAGCGDEWIVAGYSTARAPDGSDRSAWLHRVALTEGGAMTTEVLYSDSVSLPARRSLGRAELFGSAGGVLYYHREAEPQALIEWACADRSAVVLPQSRLLPGSAVGQRARRGGAEMFTLRADRPLLGGVGALSEGMIMVEMTLRGESGGSETLLRWAVGDSLLEARVEGMYVLVDSRPGDALLFRSSEPVPHVFLISENALMEVMRRDASTRAWND